MARFCKTAVAAVALFALALTPTAAYAREHHGVVGSSVGSGVSWGRYTGELTDFTTTKPDVFKGARASAIMIGMDGTSLFRLRVSGVAAKGGAYAVHLHQGKCVADDWSAAGPHYNVTWDPIDVDSHGNAQSTATVSFIPEGERSIVLHGLPTDPQTGIAGPRLACLPLDINQIE